MKGLEDAKFVAMIIYISSIVLVALALVNFGLRSFINAGNGITVAGIFTLTTVILGFNFVPKVIDIEVHVFSLLYIRQLNVTAFSD